MAKNLYYNPKTGKNQHVHPDMAKNKKFLSMRGLVPAQEAQAPPKPAATAEPAKGKPQTKAVTNGN